MPARVTEDRARRYDELRWSPSGRPQRSPRDACRLANVSKGWARLRDRERYLVTQHAVAPDPETAN